MKPKAMKKKPEATSFTSNHSLAETNNSSQHPSSLRGSKQIAAKLDAGIQSRYGEGWVQEEGGGELLSDLPWIKSTGKGVVVVEGDVGVGVGGTVEKRGRSMEGGRSGPGSSFVTPEKKGVGYIYIYIYTVESREK